MQIEAQKQPGDDRAAMLAQIERGELVTQLSVAELSALLQTLEVGLATMELLPSMLRDFAGPELHGLPAHLGVMSGMGAGYLRHCRDVIRAVLRTRAKARAKR
jgi:hypothetical protein